jgi:hypothetical protein
MQVTQVGGMDAHLRGVTKGYDDFIVVEAWALYLVRGKTSNILFSYP